MNLTGKLKLKIRKNFLSQLPRMCEAKKLKQEIYDDISKFLEKQLNPHEIILLTKYPEFIKKVDLPSLNPEDFEYKNHDFFKDIKIPLYRWYCYCSWDNGAEYECGEVFRLLNKNQDLQLLSMFPTGKLSDLILLDNKFFEKILFKIKELLIILLEVNEVMIKIDRILNSNTIDLLHIKRNFNELYNIIKEAKNENK